MTVQNKKKTFGTYIRSLRLYRGFGLRELARQLGISAPYLSNLEKDKRGAPPVDLVRAIVKILDADSENIYDLAGKSRNTIASDIEDLLIAKPEIVSLLRSANFFNLSKQQILEIKETMTSLNTSVIIIAAGLDAWRVADLLAKENVPVILDNVFRLPQRDTDPHDINFRSAGILHKKGVKVDHSVKMGNLGATEIRNIVYASSRSIAYGLPRDAALRSITLHPAQMLNVDNQLGSLTQGKEANFIATDGDLFDIRSNVKRMWIAGDEVSLESRHTRLYEKYRKRPKPKGLKR